MTTPALDSRTKASLLWGVVAFLAFLVLIQGYELLVDERVTIGVKAVVAVAVGVVSTGATFVAYGRRIERRKRARKD